MFAPRRSLFFLSRRVELDRRSPQPLAWPPRVQQSLQLQFIFWIRVPVSSDATR